MPKTKLTVKEITAKKKLPRLSQEELDELDRDDAQPVVKKKTAAHRDWSPITPSKKELELAIERAKATKAGFHAEALVSRENKMAANGALGNLQSRAERVAVPAGSIKTAEDDLERFRNEQLDYTAKGDALNKPISRHIGFLDAQRAREQEYPRPRDLKYIGFDTSVVYSAEALEKLRHEHIKPIRQKLKKIGTRPANPKIVDCDYIPAEIVAHAKRWTADVGEALFNRKTGEKGLRIQVPTMPGFYDPRLGVLRESIDPMAFMCAFFPDLMEARLRDAATAYAKANQLFIMEDDAATKAITEARAELEKWERLEESMIRAGERQGIVILRRRLAPLEAVFGYEWRRGPRRN